MLYIIYADLECLVKRMEGCENNPEISSTARACPCGYSMSTIWGFKQIKNEHTFYRGKDCMKKFYKSLREHTRRITGFEKKKVLPLTNKELKSHNDAKICYICGKYFIKSVLAKTVKYIKVFLFQWNRRL